MSSIPHYRRMAVSDIELGALEQIENCLALPFLKGIAIMPDVHQGYGVPIGTVLATELDVVIPNAVGVDIGCGMAACASNFRVGRTDRKTLEDLCKEIRRAVPVGFNKRSVPLPDSMPRSNMTEIIKDHWSNAALQLGTLGGGNHFIEIQADEKGQVWVMIHSGSRNLGKQVADYYNKRAKDLNDIWRSKVDPKVDLAFLPRGCDLYHDYLTDMRYCVEYAQANRAEMMEQVKQAFVTVLGAAPWSHCYDICHNHASIENHLGKNIMVHRKGAAGPYGVSTVGIIPGSQGTSSYLVTYKDSASPTAMRTTSHGAGRAMGRKAAQRSLSLSETLDAMKDIVHDIRGDGDLDEAPGAYKDIDAVMDNQNDLCQIITKLRPLAVVKG